MSVHLELAFQNIMQRQLSGGHTHLYTNDRSIGCARNISLSGLPSGGSAAILSIYTELSPCLWRARKTAARRPECGRDEFLPVLDAMQVELDKRQLSSEVHLLLRSTT